MNKLCHENKKDSLHQYIELEAMARRKTVTFGIFQGKEDDG